MCTRLHRLVLAAGLALLLCPTAVLAQVAAEPDTVRVALAPGDSAEVGLTLANTSGGALVLVLAPQPATEAEGTPGEILFTRSFDGITPYELTMTPDGRLFAADEYSSLAKTWEYTPDLSLVRSFEYPRLDFFSSTPGIAWMPPEHTTDPTAFPEGTLWWLDVLTHSSQGKRYLDHAILIEGDLNGEPTGRQVEITHGVGPAALPWTSGIPTGLSYDPAAEFFYYIDVIHNDVWAITVEGEVADGYPVSQTDYDTGEPFVMKGRSVDTFRVSGGESADVYFEMPVGVEPENRMMRVVLTDRVGRSLGPETPLALLEPPDGFGSVLRIIGSLRSTLDSSVMYLTVLTGEPGTVREWVYAVRAVPLPPRWLRVEPVLVDIAAGQSAEVTLRLDASNLEEGVYGAVLQVQRADGTGAVLGEVPVILTASEGTNSEDEAEPVTAARLSVWPNPSSGSATVSLVLQEASEVHVAVYDVLGRRVAMLAEGRLSAGEHPLRFDAQGLPPGLYLVRAVGDRVNAGRPVTVVQ